MRSNNMKIGLILLVSLIAIGTASANPGFNVVVTPTADTVMPGETATYSVTVIAIDTLTVEEFVELSVIDLDDNPISWDTRFSENLFIISPHQPEKTVTLEIDVPPGTPVGDYLQKVRGDAYLPGMEWLGSIESSEFPITVTVTEIPEFSTIAVPVVAVIGLLLLMRRRKE
ncbi:MAG: PEF-CTERM sorting domain-containing protein [Methanosarcinales archaeon]|nr:PEF-CTERM sorting domain-containing protein [Methanosarcinales archaeon]